MRRRRSAASVASVDRGSERGIEIVQDRDACQERQVRRIEVGEQQSDEAIAHSPLLLEQRLRRGARMAIGRHHRKHELSAEGPAIGHLVQPDGDARIEIRSEPLPDQFDRLVHIEPQVGRTNRRALPIGDQVVQPGQPLAAHPDQCPQVGWKVPKHVRHCLEGLRRKAVGLVEDKHGVERRSRDLGEQFGKPLHRLGQSRCEKGVAERRPAGGGAKRHDQAPQQPARIVRRTCRQPEHDRAVAQAFATPLREQRGLAVPGRSLDQDGRHVAKAARTEKQPGTAEQIALNARRCDFQYQPGRSLLACRGIDRREFVDVHGAGRRGAIRQSKATPTSIAIGFSPQVPMARFRTCLRDPLACADVVLASTQVVENAA